MDFLCGTDAGVENPQVRSVMATVRPAQSIRVGALATLLSYRSLRELGE